MEQGLVTVFVFSNIIDEDRAANDGLTQFADVRIYITFKSYILLEQLADLLKCILHLGNEL